jgi:hypothetical protein
MDDLHLLDNGRLATLARSCRLVSIVCTTTSFLLHTEKQNLAFPSQAARVFLNFPVNGLTALLGPLIFAIAACTHLCSLLRQYSLLSSSMEVSQLRRRLCSSAAAMSVCAAAQAQRPGRMRTVSRKAGTNYALTRWLNSRRRCGCPRALRSKATERVESSKLKLELVGREVGWGAGRTAGVRW